MITSIYKEAVLSGLNSFEYGGIFPDMSAPYNARLNGILMEQAVNLDVNLKKGVYASVLDPQ
jgi:purine-nucleoside phosphorylase